MTSNQSPPRPVAARGQVPEGHLDGRLIAAPPGQQAALQGEGGLLLLGVAAGVVDADGGARGDFLGQRDVVRLERIGVAASATGSAAPRTRPRAVRGTTIREWTPGPGTCGPGAVPIEYQSGGSTGSRTGRPSARHLAWGCPVRTRPARPPGWGSPGCWARTLRRHSHQRLLPCPAPAPHHVPPARRMSTEHGRRGAEPSHRRVPGPSPARPVWFRCGRRPRSRRASRRLGPMALGDVLDRLGHAQNPAGGILHPEGRDGHGPLRAGISAPGGRTARWKINGSPVSITWRTRSTARARPRQPATSPAPDPRNCGGRTPVNRSIARLTRRTFMSGPWTTRPIGTPAVQPVENRAVPLPLEDLRAGCPDEKPLSDPAVAQESAGPEPHLHNRPSRCRTVSTPNQPPALLHSPRRP